MTVRNPLLERLAAGGAVSCYWMALGSVAAAEVMAEARPDAIMFDTQHGLWDRQTLYNAFAAIRGKSEPVVRIADDSATAIGEAYDLGATGVIVPLVESAAQAEAIVRAAKYPPLGRRSAGGVRPMLDFNPYAEAANRELLLGVMIETAAGLKNAAAIAAVPGVDLVFIGTGDLSISLGTFPDNGPKFEQAVQSILAACSNFGPLSGKVPREMERSPVPMKTRSTPGTAAMAAAFLRPAAVSIMTPSSSSRLAASA